MLTSRNGCFTLLRLVACWEPLLPSCSRALSLDLSTRLDYNLFPHLNLFDIRIALGGIPDPDLPARLDRRRPRDLVERVGSPADSCEFEDGHDLASCLLRASS
jgi:hypothetical protein